MPEVEQSGFGQGGYKNYVRKFGRIVGATATPTIVWDGGTNGEYAGWLENEEDVEWASSSADDAPGEVGAQYIQFTGQGANGIEKTYNGVINGLTYTRLSSTDAGVLFNCIYTANAKNIEGTSKSPIVGVGNIGTITIRSVDTQKVMALIKPNQGRTQMMIWRCPADHYAELQQVGIYPASGKPMLTQIMRRTSIEDSWQVISPLDLESTSVLVDYRFPEYISPGTDLCLVAIPDQVGTNLSAEFWLEKFEIPEYEKLKEDGDI